MAFSGLCFSVSVTVPLALILSLVYAVGRSFHLGDGCLDVEAALDYGVVHGGYQSGLAGRQDCVDADANGGDGGVGR